MFSRILVLTVASFLSLSVHAASVSTADAATAEDLMDQAVSSGQDDSQVISSEQNANYVGVVACYARNLRGERFEAVGYFPRRVQARAVAKCYSFGSLRCWAVGCN